MNIGHLIQHYMAAKEQHATAPATLKDKVDHISRVFGGVSVDATGIELVEIAKKAWPRAVPGTVKRYLVQLRAILRRAERDGLIAKAPLIDVPYVHDTVYVDVSKAEVKMLLDYIQWVEPKWYPLTLLLTHTGARLGEVLSINEASFTRHGVRIAKQVGRKTKTIDRVIPYSTRLGQAVASGVYKNTSRIVPEGLQHASVSTCLGRVLDDATKALGLPTLRVHDLRHAFAAMLAEQGADLADLATALGNSSTAMSMRYRGLVKGRLNGIMATI